ncbi:MAG: cobalt ECF transporter T component CbiQ [Candidatus Promineifilaceae bacterium]
MRIIDRYAYNNTLRLIDPAYKVGLAMLVVLLCLVLNRPISSLLALAWMVGLTVGLAKIPMGVFGRILLAETTFLLLTTIGVVVSISIQQPELVWQTNVGFLWFSASPDTLLQGVQLVTRALGAASALNFLALTTPLTDIITLLQRWNVPTYLIDLMTVMYRFIFILLDTLEQMVVAQESRLGYHAGYRRGMKNAGQVGARLFINSFQRSRQLETALTARGYNGELHVLTPEYHPFPHYALYLLGILLTLSAARLLVT